MLQSLRLRITLWYTALFVVLSLVLVVTLNVLATQYYENSKIEVNMLSRSQYEGILQQPFAERLDRDQIIELVRMVRQEDLAQIRVSSFILLIILIGLSYIGGHFIAGDMLKPIQDLNRQIQAIHFDELQEITYPHQDADIQDLITSLNDMLHRLSGSFRAQREFIEHASHELKTPLSVLLLQLESLHEETILDRSQSVLLKKGIQTIVKLNDLLDNLMILSLQKEQLTFEQISVHNLLKQVVEDAELLDSECTIESLSKRDGIIKAVPDLLQRALGNIVENAVKYAGKKGGIIVTNKNQSDTVQIRIRDRGPGIPEEEKTRIFDRFYRVDKSRSQKTGGRGLGLAITKAIIELHGGRVVAQNHPEGGAEFIVTLPIRKKK